MSGTERMKNNIFRRFFSYYKNGATFDFRGRSIFLILNEYRTRSVRYLVHGFMVIPLCERGKSCIFIPGQKLLYA